MPAERAPVPAGVLARAWPQGKEEHTPWKGRDKVALTESTGKSTRKARTGVFSRTTKYKAHT